MNSPAVENPAAEPVPQQPQAVFFVDGQNLFHGAKREFGYSFPNYDVGKLAAVIALRNKWAVKQVRFYTGIADQNRDWHWNQFWQNKLRSMKNRQGIEVFSRKLVYRTETMQLPDGTTHTYSYSQEKGIDVRIALDSIRMAIRQEYDVAVIVSRDQDLSEAAKEIREIAREQNRIVEVASAYPSNANSSNHCIGGTVGIAIDHATYDACIDQHDYRPRYRR